MPEIDVGGCRIYYTEDGPRDAPILLLSNSLGTTTELWAAQVPELARTFRVVRYDTRGHGGSSVPRGDYTLDELGRDALAVLDAAGATRERRTHVCGISLGGMTAMWLGLHAADRVDRLVLANTGAKIGTDAGWAERMRDLRERGMGAIADRSMERWFTPAFRERRPEVVGAFRSMVAACPPGGYAGCSAAIRDTDLRASIAAIAAPTLVVVGAHDPSTPPTDGELLRATIPGAHLVTLDCAHLSNVERAEEFTAAVLGFLR